MVRPKSRNLWNDEEGTKSVNRPQKVAVAKGWKVAPDLLPAKPQAPRRRKYAPIRPNNRDAVATPLGGQSYNPEDEEHQEALGKAVRQLTRRKLKDEKFVKMMTLGRDKQYTGNFSADKTWEEEVQEKKPEASTKAQKSKAKPAAATSNTTTPAATAFSSSGPAAATNGKTAKPSGAAAAAAAAPAVSGPNSVKTDAAAAAAAKKKKEAKKKKTKKASAQDAKRAMAYRRHPQRDVVVKESEELDELLSSHAAKEATREAARAKRRSAKKANLDIKHYGRHYHTPLVVDVTPSDKLVGSLRHMSGGYVHPALERMKSLEERNLVPARMRHTYNKRKVLKPKGEVRVKREQFGIMPETSF